MSKINRFSIEELGEKLARETESLTDMYFEANKVNKIDKVYWLGIHLGFIAGLIVCGMNNEEAIKVVEVAQEKMKK